jgi:hypothetical protein
VNLVINHSRHKVFAGDVNDFGSSGSRDRCFDFFNAFAVDQYVSIPDIAFVNETSIS